jgi:hypothetical protein
MKTTLKTALFVSAALAALSTSAHSESLVDLKSIFEAISIRDVASQNALQIPTSFKIHPAADASVEEAVEEPFVEVKTSGYIKTGYIHSEIRDGSPLDDSSDVDVEAGLNVKASVQSSVGEIGVTVQSKWDIAESGNNLATPALRDDGIVGFWQFADTMKFEMGRGNAGRLENGILKNTRRVWTIADRRVRAENAGNGFYDRDAYNGFLGLAYASGPVTLSMRLHDATRGVTGPTGSDDDALGASAKAVFSGELITFEAVGGYWGQSNAKNLPVPIIPVTSTLPTSQTGVKWLAGVGTELNFIPGLPVSIGAQMGELHNGAEQMNVSASFGFALTDNISAGFGAGMKKVKNSPALADNRTEKVINGGIYYAPISQLIIGLEADWLDDGRPAATTNDGLTGAVVSRFNF